MLRQATANRGGTADFQGQGFEQTQFAESFRSPEPLYFAYSGNAQIGRFKPDSRFVPSIAAGARPFSRHCSSAVIESNVFGPGPPPQCIIPGTRNIRIQSSCSGPISRSTLS